MCPGGLARTLPDFRISACAHYNTPQIGPTVGARRHPGNVVLVLHRNTLIIDGLGAQLLPNKRVSSGQGLLGAKRLRGNLKTIGKEAGYETHEVA